jgi:hypothetical protein
VVVCISVQPINFSMPCQLNLKEYKSNR